MAITGLSLNGTPGKAVVTSNKTPVGIVLAEIPIPASAMAGYRGALGAVAGEISIPASSITGLTGTRGTLAADIPIPVSVITGSIPVTFTGDLLRKYW